jgi:DNA-binding CsgD family transcriptional regulator
MRTWPFVGRVAEREQLYRAIHDRNSRGVVIAGAPGVGKTSLATRALRMAESAGLVTERVMATTATMAWPLGAMALLLPAGFGELTDLRDQADLIRRAVDALIEKVGGARLALLVDDAHLLDPTSAVLIYQLVLTDQAFVIATLRSKQPAPGPIVDLWKQDLLERLDLDTVPDDVVADSVTEYLDGPVATALTDALAQRCGGNLLFVRELVLGALAEGTIRRDAGLWMLDGPLHPSARLIELVEARLSTTTPVERRFLEVLALGEPLGEAELAALTSPEVLERLEGQGLITTGLTDGRLSASLAHPLHGEVLRETLTNAQVRRISRQLVEVIEAVRSRLADDLLRVAQLRLLCGGGSPTLLVSAARLAKGRFDFQLTARLARAAVAVGGGLDAQLLLAEATALSGRREDAETQFTALAGTVADGDGRAHLALLRLHNAHHLLQPRANLRIADEALAIVADPALRAELSAVRSWTVLLAEGPGPCLADLGSTAGLSGSPLLSNCLVRAFALAHAGRTTAAIDSTVLGRATQATLSENYHLPVASHDSYLCLALLGSGRLAESEQAATSAYRRAVADRLVQGQALAAYPLALTYLQKGHAYRAVHLAREAVALCHQTNDHLLGSQCLLLLAHACAISGDGEGAADAMIEFEALALPPMWHFAGLLETRAWLAAAAGDLPTALELLEREIAIADANGDLLRQGAALHTMVRFGRARAAVTRLGALAERVEGDLAVLRASHATASAEHDAPTLEELSSAFEGMGADLLAAEASADAAAAWHKARANRAAASAHHRAASLLTRCEGATSPATRAVGARALLTAAERETAILAAAGRTNKEIADVQHIAVRTVETRLQNVYSKLGITRRGDIHGRLGNL